jgi:hypothetical protein
MRAPLSVQRARVLLAGAALVAAVSVACAVDATTHMNHESRKLEDLGFTARDVKDLRDGIGGSLTSIIVLSALTAVFLVVGALVVRRPNGRARLVACAAAVIGLFLAFVTLSASPEEFTSSDGPALVRAVYANLLPSWYVYFTSIFVAVEAIVLITAAVLLFRSDSGEYYRAAAGGGGESLGEHMLRLRRETDGSAS